MVCFECQQESLPGTASLLVGATWRCVCNAEYILTRSEFNNRLEWHLIDRVANPIPIEVITKAELEKFLNSLGAGPAVVHFANLVRAKFGLAFPTKTMHVTMRVDIPGASDITREYVAEQITKLPVEKLSQSILSAEPTVAQPES